MAKLNPNSQPTAGNRDGALRLTPGTQPAAGSRGGRAKLKKAFIFSIEALLAAVLLFGIFLLISDINGVPKTNSGTGKILATYSEGLANSLDSSGALDRFFRYSDDSQIKNLIGYMPPSTCAKIEIYSDSPSIENLIYSYTPSECTMLWDTPAGLSIYSYANRTDSTTTGFYWIKAYVYARQ
ncbi:MAG: hypothetical protein V1822_02995 [Candidatus Micrarchaeota archaeon]